MTGCQLARANQKVLVVAAGMGALLLASGCIDVLGFQPTASTKPLKNPLDKLGEFLAERPNHPYHLIGRANLETGLNDFLQLVNNDSLNYHGSPHRNWLLPSAAGAARPTCLAPASLAKGELSQGGRMLIVGFKQLRDFYPSLVSQNLNEQNLGVQAGSLVINLPPTLIADDMNITPIELAHAMERSDFRGQVVRSIKARSQGYDRIGFPAVLGLKQHAKVTADLEQQLGKTVFEISTLPPSVPGRRLFERLRHIFVEADGRLIIGSRVVAGAIEAGRVSQIQLETANRLRAIKAQNYILATGGIYGGGIQTDSDGAAGKVWEPIFGLPVEADPNRHRWFTKGFLEPNGQPFASYGLKVNKNLNPVDGSGNVSAENLYVVGASLAGADWTPGRTGDGLALGSAAAVVKQLVG
jgi:glycerol-3-phosphate dehydrogenase subunit B